jgi:hypothetical protein
MQLGYWWAMHMHERRWQFRLNDETVVDCVGYFGKRAKEVAAAINCEVISSNVVKIERLRGNVRKIIGTALLENPRENILEFQKRRNRQR